MPNLYGVANPVILPAVSYCIGSTNVACPAGTETNVITSAPLVAISSGYYYPSLMGVVCVSMGATGPTSLTVAGRIGVGADFWAFGAAGAAFPANGFIMIPVTIFGPASATPWQGTGSTVSFSINPAAQAVTALFSASWLWITLYRAPDQ